jgi:hypothetical protein
MHEMFTGRVVTGPVQPSRLGAPDGTSSFTETEDYNPI